VVCGQAGSARLPKIVRESKARNRMLMDNLQSFTRVEFNFYFPGRVREVRVARACAVGGCAGCAGPTPRHITRVLSSFFPPSTLGAIPRVSPHKLGGWSGCAHRQLSAPHTRKHTSWGVRFASSFPRPRLQRGRCDCAGRYRRACGQLFLRTPRQCHPTPRPARHAVVAAVST